MLCVRRWSDAGRPAGRVSCWQVQYNAESPKQDIKRFNSVTKTDPLCPSRYIFICGVWQLAIMLSDRFHKKQKDKEYIVCSAVPVFDSVFPYLANRRI